MTTLVEAAKPTDANRPSTQADAIALGRVYARLVEAKKGLTTEKSALEKGLAVWSAEADTDTLLSNFNAAATNYADELRACREIINGLPNGVTGPGGKATKQTIVLEFYGPVNRNLNTRLSASDAKTINKAAFGR